MNPNGSSGWLTPTVSFAAGIASASLVYYLTTTSGNSKRYDADGDTTEDQGDGELISGSRSRRGRLARWMSVEDLSNRIGELPSLRRRRGRWPWDKPKNRAERSSSPPRQQDDDQE